MAAPAWMDWWHGTTEVFEGTSIEAVLDRALRSRGIADELLIADASSSSCGRSDATSPRREDLLLARNSRIRATVFTHPQPYGNGEHDGIQNYRSRHRLLPFGQ